MYFHIAHSYYNDLKACNVLGLVPAAHDIAKKHNEGKNLYERDQ